MKFTRSARGGLFLVCITLLFASAVCHGQPRPTVSVDYTSPDKSGPAWVLINGRVAARFLTPNGALSPTRRAEITAERLQALAATTTDFSKIKAVWSAAQGQIVGPNGLIFVVTSEEAAAEESTVPALTQKFAGAVRWLMSMPPLQLSRTSVLVPVGESRTVEVGGALLDPFTVTSSNPEVIKASSADKGRAVVLTAAAQGDAQVTVSCQAYQAVAQVSARKYAGRIAAAPRIGVVTGTPAPSDICEEAALTAALRSLVVEHGASAAAERPKAQPLQTGESQTVKIPVRIEGPDYIPVAGEISVEIENLPLHRPQAESLMYSNNPERITKYGNLFAGRLETGKPARLLYHHQNALAKAAVLDIEIVNPTASEAQVHIIHATPEPRVDTVLIGYRAGTSFLKAYLSNAGEVLSIPPNSKVPIYSARLRQMDTASGIMDLAQLSGEPLLVHVFVRTPDQPILTVGLPMPVCNGDGNLLMSDHLYTAPLKSVDALYQVGGPWSFIRIGKEAIKGLSAAKSLYGNYGVLYEIRLNLENPTTASRTVEVLFEPSAGIASGVFWIDGETIGTTHRKPPQEVPLAKYRLSPNAKRSILIRTIPLSGSNYPATILVRS